jgi:DnaK suppressor protein
MPVKQRGRTSGSKKPCKKRMTSGSVVHDDREKSILDIKKQLLEQKRQLLQEAGVALNSLPDEELFSDMGDQASAEVEKNFMLRLRGREQRLLNKIEIAIESIDNGTYGICDVCGCEIEIKRLKARPVTTMCIECKTEQEEEEKRM